MEQLLAATPQQPSKRRLRQQISHTPEKEAPAPKVRCIAVSSSSSSKTVGAPQDTKEKDLTISLFDGIENVLVLMASRRSRAILSAVRQHVEELTQRDLTDERLERVLAAAGNMLEAVWVGSNLELVQRLRAGEHGVPTNAERIERREAFKATLVSSPQSLPRRPLPGRPQASGSKPTLPCKETPSHAAAPDPIVEVVAKAKREAEICIGPPAGAAERRMDALRVRIMERQASEARRKAYLGKIGQLESRIALCHDSLAVHAVLVQLFARGECEDSAASEAEVVSGLCSSMQSKRIMEAEAARAALDYLTSRAITWYEASAPQHSQLTGVILRRFSDGCSSTCAEELQLQIRELQEARRLLLAKGAEAVAEAELQGGRRRRLNKKTLALLS